MDFAAVPVHIALVVQKVQVFLSQQIIVMEVFILKSLTLVK